MTFYPSMPSGMCWALSRCRLFCLDLQQGSCGGRDGLCLKLEELIQGRSAVPLPLSDNHPKETQLPVAISKPKPSTAALCKKERPQDNRLILYFSRLMDTRPLSVLCWVPKFESSPALGSWSLGRQIKLRLCRHFSTGLFLPARPRSWDELCSSWQALSSNAWTLP